MGQAVGWEWAAARRRRAREYEHELDYDYEYEYEDKRAARRRWHAKAKHSQQHRAAVEVWHSGANGGGGRDDGIASGGDDCGGVRANACGHAGWRQTCGSPA